MEPRIFRRGSELAGGRYTLERRLGSGGMATVWLGLDNRLARRVAIKIPSEEIIAEPSFSIRFEREAQTAAALSHPHLVSVYDYGCEGERPYLVSEFVDGSNLAELREEGRAPSAEALAETLLDALAHIHEAGIVHRDVKPGNVLVDKAGHILLTDFGIAQSGEATGLTNEGHVVGTPSYLAPEVERGGRATAASDLYSLGVLLSQQQTDRDPDRIGRLIGVLTNADPAGRPASAGEAREMIERRNVEVTAVNPVTEVAQPAPRPAAAVLLPAERPTPAEMGARRTSGDDAGPGGGLRKSGNGWLIVGGLVALVLIAVAAIAIVSGGSENASGGGRTGDGQASRATTTTAPSTTTAPTTTATATTTEAPPPVTPAGGTDPARGIELNNEGYALLQGGDVSGALPKLRRAVASFPEDSTEIDYAYALFNYAQALRLSGDPAAAIPLLLRRLAFSDFKVDEVRAELAAAEQAAG